MLWAHTSRIMGYACEGLVMHRIGPTESTWIDLELTLWAESCQYPCRALPPLGWGRPTWISKSGYSAGLDGQTWRCGSDMGGL